MDAIYERSFRALSHVCPDCRRRRHAISVAFSSRKRELRIFLRKCKHNDRTGQPMMIDQRFREKYIDTGPEHWPSQYRWISYAMRSLITILYLDTAAKADQAFAYTSYIKKNISEISYIVIIFIPTHIILYIIQLFLFVPLFVLIRANRIK